MDKMIKTSLFLAVILTTLLFNQPAYAGGASIEAKQRANEVAMLITHPGMTDYEKAVAVHDWLCANCQGNLLSVETGRYLASDHSADGPLLYGISVCEGYAEAFRVFMDILGIKNMRVNGYADGTYHAWNSVYIDGQWLEVDVTYDDPIFVGCEDPGGVYSRQYCLISSTLMALDHYATSYF